MVLNIESCSEGGRRRRGTVARIGWDLGSGARERERERERESCIVALGTLNLLTKLD